MKADFFDLLHHSADDHLQKVLPAGTGQFCGEIARNQFRAKGQDEHEAPREGDGAVNFQKSVLPQDHLIGTKAHGVPPGRAGLSRGSGHLCHEQTRHDETKQTRDQPLHVLVRHEIESGQYNACPEQHAAEEPKRRLLGC